MGGSRAKLCEQFSLWTRWARRAVLGLTASLRLLTGYLTGWNSKTTHVYAPPYGFTPPTPPKRPELYVPLTYAHLCSSAHSNRMKREPFCVPHRHVGLNSHPGEPLAQRLRRC